ncbi:MAG: DUF4954 family protein [Prevotellaceae bacterium]|nr:DUF4954 family protein [Candidatus Colivivens equi]
MRKLTIAEIEILESRQRCWAEDWSLILVADDFDTCSIRNTNFYGYVEIGRGTRISNVKMIKGSGKEGSPNIISVLNEGGDGNIVLVPQLTAQLAWLMIHYPVVFDLVTRQSSRTIKKTTIGECAVIEGASKIVDSVILSQDDASTYLGTDVIIENSVVACNATITDGAKVYESFVGESVHIGKGFSSETSLFFANSYMDNGESCAALCGPFSCSHHKSTLLIGGEFSFYNAGSNTNQSNHAYKMGPIHWGTLRRGAKTASGCHILWPATIGAFSMVMGKLTQHPDLSRLPFSYVLASPDKTYIVPGINIKTVGTWRDVNKWPKRDERCEMAKHDIITFDFPNPYIRQYVKQGIEELTKLQTTSNSDEYYYEGCFIRKDALEKGLEYYKLILDICDTTWKDDEYVDMLGFIVRKSEIESVVTQVKNNEITNIEDILEHVAALECDYSIKNPNAEAYDKWIELIKADAKKEFDMGDVSEEQLNDFVKGIKWVTATHLYHQHDNDN